MRAMSRSSAPVPIAIGWVAPRWGSSTGRKCFTRRDGDCDIVVLGHELSQWAFRSAIGESLSDRPPCCLCLKARWVRSTDGSASKVEDCGRPPHDVSGAARALVAGIVDTQWRTRRAVGGGVRRQQASAAAQPQPMAIMEYLHRANAAIVALCARLGAVANTQTDHFNEVMIYSGLIVLLLTVMDGVLHDSAPYQFVHSGAPLALVL